MALGSPARSIDNAGVYIGTITRLTGDGAYLELPRLTPGFEYGPARHPDGVSAGDDVAVAFLEGSRDDVVVLIRLA